MKLQSLDREWRWREERLEAIPKELTRLEKQLEAEKAKEASVKEQLKQKTIRRREAEGKIEDLEDKVKKYQIQLNEVKTNDQYTALLHEIAAVKTSIREIEEEVLELMEAIEAHQKEGREAEKVLAEASREHETKKKALEEERIRATQERDALKAEREALVSLIINGALRKYERVRAAIPENPVVEVTEGGACGGCFAQITLQRQSEIKKSADLMSCENCGRIVYYKNC